MTITPWGEASTLRRRRLRPGPGVPRADVERNQRERLYGAMVAVAAEVGYGRTRVADLIELAGVSRATFYGYFENKEECFLATVDEIVAAALVATREEAERSGTLEERARRAVRAYATMVASQPAAARLCLVESYAAGPAAVERVDRALAGFEELISRLFAEPAGGATMPPELVSALTRAVRKIVHTRLHRRSEGELVELLPEVVDLLLTYRPPPRPLAVPSEAGAPGAPGAPIAAGDEEPGDLAPAERIERATLELVAEHGVAEAPIAAIASRAGVSLSTFYVEFEGREAALEAALESARGRAWKSAEPAIRASRDWPHAIRAGLEAVLAFHEREPDFSRVVTGDVYAAGAAELERLDRSIERLAIFLEGGYELSPAVAPAAREAIPSAIYAMLCERVASAGPEGLRELTPLATYLVLAPFVGPEEACAVAGAEHPAGAAR